MGSTLAVNASKIGHIMKIPKKYTPIEVTWCDSVHDAGWTSEKEYLEETDAQMYHRTCGYFLKESPKRILIVQSMGDVANSKGLKHVDACMMIPKSCVLSIKKLK
jgi:hypothetical protein